jgi:hypothetical protein
LLTISPRRAKNTKSVGAVPLFDHVQTFVDLSAQRFRIQIPTEENRLDGLAQKAL